MELIKRQSVKTLYNLPVTLLDAEIIYIDELRLGVLNGADAIKNYRDNKHAESKGIYKLSGRIQLKDFQLHKNVQVHYSFNNQPWGVMEPGNVRYVKDLDYNVELWEFCSDVHFLFREKAENIVHPEFQLAISYEVDGKRYWDNNFWNSGEHRWNNHRITFPFYLGNRPVCWYNGNNNWSEKESRILVKKMESSSVNEVFVRCSTDNWKSYIDVPALEFWEGSQKAVREFLVDFSFATTETMQFAVCGKMGEEVFWDNNFGKNFMLSSMALF